MDTEDLETTPAEKHNIGRVEETYPEESMYNKT